MSGLRLWLVALGLAVLAACSSLPQSESARPEFVGAQPTPAQPFQRQGRFAVHAQSHGEPPQAVQGGFSWRDDGEQLQLELRNPLGQTMAQLRVGAEGAWLFQEGQPQRFAPSADSLAQEIFQQPVPVEGLRDWLRGQLGPAANDIRLDDDGRASEARDRGWRLELSRYDQQGPGRLLLVFQQGSQRITVRLVIDGAPET